MLRSAGLGETIETVIRWGRWPILAAALTVGLAVIYRYAPDRDEPDGCRVGARAAEVRAIQRRRRCGHAASGGCRGADHRSPHDRFWGGYSGYFQDPDGHLWEIAWNPAWEPDA